MLFILLHLLLISQSILIKNTYFTKHLINIVPLCFYSKALKIYVYFYIGFMCHFKQIHFIRFKNQHNEIHFLYHFTNFNIIKLLYKIGIFQLAKCTLHVKCCEIILVFTFIVYRYSAYLIV
jgi:hypothetical protein